MTHPPDAAPMGVVIVTYSSADVIGACLESLLASVGPPLRIVVVDNASPDDTVAVVRRIGADAPDDRLHLLQSPVNRGFAGGVNLGLAHLRRDPAVDLFWVLNPDSRVTPGTAAAYRAAARGQRFGLMGGRTLYDGAPGLLQSDGGRVRRPFGICQNLNQGKPPETAQPPDPTTLDFVSGANMVASREFLEAVGPMREDYFLFYEEVDWAFRRGDLPLAVCPEAVVHHQGGTATGAGSVRRLASPFANYFNYRNQMRFVRRHMPSHQPTAYGYAMARIARLLLWRAWAEAGAALRGLHGLPPPRAVRARIAAEAWPLAFGPPDPSVPRWDAIEKRAAPEDGALSGDATG